MIGAAPSERILVVEDDIDLRDALADLLESHGYAVETATAIIQAHRRALDVLFEHLLTHETAEREELVALLGPPLVASTGVSKPDRGGPNA